MSDPCEKLAQQHLGRELDDLTEQERNVILKIAERNHVSHNTNKVFDNQLTFGQRVADKVASFGGSWPFIIIFFVLLTLWILMNTVLLKTWNKIFDPYPFILLNLILSMLASIQAPVIMMSQNRQSAKDRLDAAHGYEVNLRAELEIIDLHQKIDNLREQQWKELISMQEKQLLLINQLLEKEK